jgi:hypothetical protein
MFRDQESAVQGIPFLLNLAFLAALGVLLAGRRFMGVLIGISDRAFASVSGHLRRPPDPWLEGTLRRAFAEFDRNLATILHHEQARDNEMHHASTELPRFRHI